MDKRKSMTDGNESSANAQYKLAINGVRELLKDSSFAKHRRALEDIQKALEKASENDKRLSAKCQKLQSDISANATKIKAAIQLSKEDKSTIDTLKEELEKSWLIAEDLRMERNGSANGNSDPKHSAPKNCSTLGDSLISPFHEKLQRKLRNYEDAEKLWIIEKQSLQREVDVIGEQLEALRDETLQLQKRAQCLDCSLRDKDETILQLENNFKVVQEMSKSTDLGSGDQDRLKAEIETNRLQIFELEEEVANKDKLLEELVSEVKLKSRKLDEMEKEILELSVKVKMEDSSIRTNNRPSEICLMGATCECENHKNLEMQLQNMTIKESKIYEQVKWLHFNLEEKTKMLMEVQNENKTLKLHLCEKNDLLQNFYKDCSAHKEELNKNNKFFKELENMRDRHVHCIGSLETKVCELKKELSKQEFKKYPETVDCLRKEILVLKEELEKEKEKYLKCNTSWKRVILERDELKQLHLKNEKYVNEALEAIVTIQSNNQERKELDETDTNMVLVNDESSSCYPESRIAYLKERIMGLVQFCREVMAEKRELLSEIEEFKSIINSQVYYNETEQNSDPKKGASWNEEVNMTEEETSDDSSESSDSNYNETSEQESFTCDADIGTANLEDLEADFENDQTFPSSECETIPKSKYDTSIMNEEKLSKAFDSNNLIESNEKATNLSFGFDLEEVRKRQQREIKVETIKAQDLLKYRAELRMKQKNLDLMAAGVGNYSPNFSTNRSIYRKANEVKKTSPVRRLHLDRNKF